MAEEGFCHIFASGGTIVYCVDSEQLENAPYKLKVYSVVPTLYPPSLALLSEAGGE